MSGVVAGGNLDDQSLAQDATECQGPGKSGQGPCHLHSRLQRQCVSSHCLFSISLLCLPTRLPWQEVCCITSKGLRGTFCCVPFWNLPRVRLWSLAHWNSLQDLGLKQQRSRAHFSLTLPALQREDFAIALMLKVILYLLYHFSKSTFCALYKPIHLNPT